MLKSRREKVEAGAKEMAAERKNGIVERNKKSLRMRGQKTYMWG